MTVTLIASVTRSGVIGAEGDLAWRNSEDLRRFKSLTMGLTLVMGRRTFESIGRALPGRRTIVVSRDAGLVIPGVDVADSVGQALDLAGGGDVIVAGGGQIYAQTIGLADRLEITHIDADLPGDTYFPAIAPAEWEQVAHEQREGFAFVSYRRRPHPITDLTELLSGLEPQLREGRYVFGTVAGGIPGGVEPVVAVVEDEGTTLVLPYAEAVEQGFDVRHPMAWITLRVASSLEAVGLTAAVSTALTTDGIACNVVAGFHHDHLFVPDDRAHDAMACLAALAHTRS